MKIARFAAISSMVLMLGLCVMVQDSNAQGRRGGFGGGFNSPIMLLANEQVREELEIVDDQIEQLDDIQQEMRDKMREVFRGGGGGGDREAMMEKVQEMMKDVQADVDEILLPHQSKRLKQIAAQQSMRGRNGFNADALTRGNLAEELDLSEDQMDELKKKAEEAQKEYEKKVAKLREEMKDDVLGSVLTKEQMEKFEELMGEPMTLDMSRFRRGGQGRGGQGGRGGRGGQQRNDF